MDQDPEFSDLLGFEEVTGTIKVAAQSYFLSNQSNPDEDIYIWAYQIEVTNLGDTSVQLLNRHWVITDAKGHIEEVKGAGVVGLQPVIRAGQSHRYTSGTPLGTPSGFMRGRYEMLSLDDDRKFWVNIPAFLLDSPHTQGIAH